MTDNQKRWKATSAKYISTLVYLDEPQVVLLDHGDDAKIIGVAIEYDGLSFPFLGAEISFDQWVRYNREFVDLRYLFSLPRWKRWFIFDLADQDEDDMIKLSPVSKEYAKNEKYLPSHGFWARNHTEESPKFGSIASVVPQQFNIDGTWDPADISLFFGRFNDLYSFFLGIGKFMSGNATPDQKRMLVDAFSGNTLHSGFNYVNFYGDLKGLVGFGERLAMSAIVKQSPGYVKVEGVSDVLQNVSSALQHFDEGQEHLKELYSDLHKYLSRMKLLKSGGSRLEKNDPISQEIDKKNAALAKKLCIDLVPISQLTGSDALSTAKIVLAHYRRLERYHSFFAEGRVQ